MEPLSIEIVPALPGFFTVYSSDDEKEIWLGEPVIAWRIKTFFKKGSNEVFSTCFDLNVEGDAASNCIGIQNPDMTVTVFEDSTYRSLKVLQEQRLSK